MIIWRKEDFDVCGFTHDPSYQSVNEHIHLLSYQGDVLRYWLSINEEENCVGISGDIQQPFGGDSMYEISAECCLILFEPEEQVEYRRFRFSFYNTTEPTAASLRLTVSGRK